MPACRKARQKKPLLLDKRKGRPAEGGLFVCPDALTQSEDRMQPTAYTTPSRYVKQREPILRVIRRKCLDCSAGQPSEVRLCPVTACPLHPYRMGEDPFARPRGQKLPLQKNSPLIATKITHSGHVIS
jgi:hypothetical protein